MATCRSIHGVLQMYSSADSLVSNSLSPGFEGLVIHENVTIQLQSHSQYHSCNQAEGDEASVSPDNSITAFYIKPQNDLS